MKSNSLLRIIIQGFLVIALIAIIPSGLVLADANYPTATPEPEPTATEQPDDGNNSGQTETDPTPTNVPVFPTADTSISTTPVPPPTSLTGGLSLLNRILLVILAIVTVLVMGVIVYAIYYRTRQEGLGDR